MILGVDVWEGYGAIDWVAARAAGVCFSIAKCTVGNDPHRDDRKFRANVDGARAAGIVVGGYHFHYGLDPAKGPAGRSGREQAERYWERSGGLGGELGDLPPALDLEWPSHWEHENKADPSSRLVDLWAQWKTGPQVIVDNALECLARLEELSGRVPIVYTYPDYIANLVTASGVRELERYPLWIASYGKRHQALWVPSDGDAPTIPRPWTEHAIWQFSADGSPMRIPGIPAAPIDRNCMANAMTLARLAGIEGDPPSSWETVSQRDFEIVHPDVLAGSAHPEHGEDE